MKNPLSKLLTSQNKLGQKSEETSHEEENRKEPPWKTGTLRSGPRALFPCQLISRNISGGNNRDANVTAHYHSLLYACLWSPRATPPHPVRHSLPQHRAHAARSPQSSEGDCRAGGRPSIAVSKALATQLVQAAARYPSLLQTCPQFMSQLLSILSF